MNSGQRVFDAHGNQIHEGDQVKISNKCWKVLNFVYTVENGVVVDIVANVQNADIPTDVDEYVMVLLPSGTWRWPRAKRKA